MNVYEMEGFLRGKCLPGDMKVNERNAQYLVRIFSEMQSQNAELAVQLANAESKCRELAAENVAVKECASDVMRHVYRSKTYLDSNRVVDAIQGIQCAIERKAGKTPATDTFLAEVRASGVDALVERRLTAARLAKEAGHEITARDLEDEAIRARFFAVEIRKGVQS